MKTIYKYTAPIENDIAIPMPEGAEVLCVQMQHGQPRIWALIDVNAPMKERRFMWRGTGHLANTTGRYIGTVQQLDGRLVFHLFEAP